MITVGRHDINNQKPYGANWGEKTIFIFAPGENILSTFPEHICENHNYVFSDGTRMCEIDSFYRIRWLSNVNNGKYNLDELLNNFSNYHHDTPAAYMSSEHHASGYHYMSGSSMATPHVSGVAALLLSINNNLTAAQLKFAILNSADQITIHFDGSTQKVKKLNAYNAFKYVMNNHSLSTTLNSNQFSISKK